MGTNHVVPPIIYLCVPRWSVLAFVFMSEILHQLMKTIFQGRNGEPFA